MNQILRALDGKCITLSVMNKTDNVCQMDGKLVVNGDTLRVLGNNDSFFRLFASQVINVNISFDGMIIISIQIG